MTNLIALDLRHGSTFAEREHWTVYPIAGWSEAGSPLVVDEYGQRRPARDVLLPTEFHMVVSDDERVTPRASLAEQDLRLLVNRRLMDQSDAALIVARAYRAPEDETLIGQTSVDGWSRVGHRVWSREVDGSKVEFSHTPLAA
jgi:hypothetical protein